MSTYASSTNSRRSHGSNRTTEKHVLEIGVLPFEKSAKDVSDSDAWKSVKDLVRLFLFFDDIRDEPRVYVSNMSENGFEPWAFVSFNRAEDARAVFHAIDGNTWYGETMMVTWRACPSQSSSEQDARCIQQHRPSLNPQPLPELPFKRIKQLRCPPCHVQYRPRIEDSGPYCDIGLRPDVSNMTSIPPDSGYNFQPSHAYQYHPPKQGMIYWPLSDQWAQGSMLFVPSNPLPPLPVQQPTENTTSNEDVPVRRRRYESPVIMDGRDK